MRSRAKIGERGVYVATDSASFRSARKALALSTEDRGLIISRLIDSLDGAPPEEGVEAAWSDEIKRRVEEIQSGKVEMIAGEEMDRWFTARLSNARRKPYRPHP